MSPICAPIEARDDRPAAMIFDIFLDGDRLNMLLDIICADYITACYASRENGKRVVFKALEKLYISVHARAPVARTDRRNLRPAQDVAFQERAHVFYDDLMAELHHRKRTLEASIDDPANASLDDSVVREVMKPKLLQIVEEVCRERDRQALLSATLVPSIGATARANAVPMDSGQEVHEEVVVPPAGEIRMEGWLRKKGQHVNLWRERYFMIRTTPEGTHLLCYLRKKGDKEPRGWYVLGPGTTVDEVRESPSKIETKKLFTFRLQHLSHTWTDDVDESGTGVEMTPRSTPARLNTDLPFSPLDAMAPLHDMDATPGSLKRSSSRKFRHRAAAAAAAATAATAVVLTGGLAGVGMGVMGMSMSAAAAASAGAAGAMMAHSRSKGPIALAAESLETAVWWRTSLLECIAQAEDQWKRYLQWYMDHDLELDVDAPVPDPRLAGPPVPLLARHCSVPLPRVPSAHTLALPARPRSGSFGSMPRSIAKTFRTSATFSQETTWRRYAFASALRVDTERLSPSTALCTSGLPPALRTSLKVPASPRTVFDMLINLDTSFYASNHVIQAARVLEAHVKDHSDVVYWQLCPTYLWPVHVRARDVCLLRYWRMEPDGSYFICFQSTTHAKCPSPARAVRASVLGGGFIISPRVHEDYDNHFDECWVTLTIQVNPHGWLDSKLARAWYYVHAYGVYFLEMITALTAAHGMHTLRPGTPASTRRRTLDTLASPVAPDDGVLLERYRTDLTVLQGLPTKFWSEPSASGFFVRGPQYFASKRKVPSARQACRLVGVELFASTAAIEHIGVASVVGDGVEATPPSLGAVDDRPFLLIINFMLPGPSHHALVLYFTPEDPLELQQNSVFADLCHEVFRGANNDFRAQRLKLLPRVVQGSGPIREGVGTTPAILGTKIQQHYYQGPHYLEVDYDVGSSTVATNVVNLLLGYSRNLIIDLAFVIEAQSVLELPERVLGTVRLDSIDLRHAVPYPVKRRMDKK